MHDNLVVLFSIISNSRHSLWNKSKTVKLLAIKQAVAGGLLMVHALSLYLVAK